MVTAAAIRNRPLRYDPRGTRSLGWWGMSLVVVTEASFFAYLLFSYFYLASQQRGAWPPSGPPDLALTLPNTIILLASSAVLIWADKGIRGGSLARLRWGMLGTVVLGVIFIVIQTIEYSHKSFGPSTDVYGSLFYTITGFHGAHVCVGLIMLIVVLVRAWTTGYTAERHLPVKTVALYWHFVDVVWLAVFCSLYLSPRLR
jgi:heme/copper-type cytochrome/quinol oxidase subunit 3